MSKKSYKTQTALKLNCVRKFLLLFNTNFYCNYRDLSNNVISQIIGGSFNKSTWNNIEILFLQKNRLTLISQNAFIGFNELEVL